MALAKPLEPTTLYDLDNVICLEDRTVVGFVLELVGPVSHPLYNIQFYPNFVDKLQTEAQAVVDKVLQDIGADGTTQLPLVDKI
jgi:rRNA processing protein Gar1